MSTDTSNPTPSPKPKWAARMGAAARRATTMAIPTSSSSTSLALDGPSPPVTSKDDLDAASMLTRGDDTASINLKRSASKVSILGGMGLRRKNSVASLDPASQGSTPAAIPPQIQAHDEGDRISVRSKETSKGMFGLRGRRGTSTASVDRVEVLEADAGQRGRKIDDRDADTASVKGKSPGRNMFGLKKKSESSASLDRMTSPLARGTTTADEDTDRASVRSKSPSRSFMGLKMKRNTSSVSLEQPLQQDSTTDRPIIKKKASRTGSLLSFGLGKKHASKTSLEITPPGSSPSVPGSRAPTPPLSHVGYVPSPIAESPMREAEAIRQEQQGSSLAHQAHVVFAEPNEEVSNPPPPMDAEDPNADAEAAYLTSPTDYVPPPVVDSTAGNPGAFMDDPESLPQPTVLKDPWGVGGSGHADWVDELGHTTSPASVERGMGGAVMASPVSAIPNVTADEHVDLTKGEAAEYYNPAPPAPVMPIPESHPNVGLHGHDKPTIDDSSPPSMPHDISLSSPQTYEPSPEKRYADYQWSDKPNDVLVPYDGEGRGEAIYVDPGTRGIEIPHPEPYTISTSPHQETYSPHDEHAYMPTIPSETSPLLPPPTQMPHPRFFQGDSATWEWEAHRLISGSSYFVCSVKWSGGMRRVVCDLDMSREDVRRSVGEFVGMKIGGGSVDVVPYVGGVSGAVERGVGRDEGGVDRDEGGVDRDGEWYVRELEDPERIAALLRVQKQRQGIVDENDNSMGGKLVKKGRTKKKRRSTIPAPLVLLLEMWSVDHVQRKVTRWGDERRDYEGGGGGGGGEMGGYGAMGSTGSWGWKGKATSRSEHGDEQEEDALDSAYRYWLYVDSHPSHIALPAHAREEALEVLQWAWTDGVLPASGAASHFSFPGRPKRGVIASEGGQRVSFAKPTPLFGQEECEELKRALLAFEDEGHDRSHGKKRPSLSISTGGRSTPSHGHSHSHSHSLSHSYPYSQSYPSSQPQAQNRLIARIFLRLLSWRQAHSRSDLPLPSSAFDVAYPPLPPYALAPTREPQTRQGAERERARERRQSVFLPSKQNKTSWAKIIRDFAGLVLCLGIPYLFVKRAGMDRADGERGTVNVNGSTGYVVQRREGGGTVGMFLMWGVTCVLAATTLSLSIALLTLPSSDPSQGSDRWSFSIPRIAALVALVFAVASLVASGVVIWRHSHEHGRSHGRRDSMGGRSRALPLEGVVVKETLIPSLPIVFLAYAIMALVFAVVMMMVKNGTLMHKGMIPTSFVGDVKDDEWTAVRGSGEWRKFSLLLFGGAVGAVVAIGYVILWG